MKPRSITDIGQHQAGFTLIEVLVALAIFSIGFMAVAAVQIDALRNVRSSQDRTMALMLMDEQVEELKRIPLYAGNPLTNNFTISTEFQPVVGGGTRILTSDDGQYEVHWWVGADITRACPNIWVSGGPCPVSISRTVIVTVIEAGQDPVDDALMRVEFIKSWATDSEV